MGNVQHITRFFARNRQKKARPSLRPVEDHKERFSFSPIREVITQRHRGTKNYEKDTLRYIFVPGLFLSSIFYKYFV